MIELNEDKEIWGDYEWTCPYCHASWDVHTTGDIPKRGTTLFCNHCQKESKINNRYLNLYMEVIDT